MADVSSVRWGLSPVLVVFPFVAPSIAQVPAATGKGAWQDPVSSSSHFAVKEAEPPATAVPDAEVRKRILATGLPCKLLDRRTGIELVLIPPGRFEQGALDEDRRAMDDERPRHTVEITKPFYLGIAEVSMAQYRRAESLRKDRGFVSFLSDDHPMILVSWAEASEYCRIFGYDLPTEAEWEYACRAGSKGRWPWEDSEDPRKVARTLESHDDPTRKFDELTYATSAGTYPCNGFGLYDMIGNAWEWCKDAYSETFYAELCAKGVAIDPVCTKDTSSRVARGGGWRWPITSCTVTHRFADDGREHIESGFRVVLRCFQ